MSKEQLLDLMRKFEEKKATPEEVDILFEHLKNSPDDEFVNNYIAGRLNEFRPDDNELNYWKERMEGKKIPGISSLPGKAGGASVRILRFPSRQFLRYAAAVLLITATAGYFIFRTSSQHGDETLMGTNAPSSPTANDVGPGGNKAILTLADGSTIVLDSAGSGMLAEQGSAKVMKAADGTILYTASGVERSPAVMYNTMSTPRGGQYQLTLPDGTRVWLNAVSSITFPTAFTGNERSVAISGEVYFEVAHDAALPFRVKINDQNDILVLGTHFNINSYSDETSIRTTLIEGSVKVSSAGRETVLTPGQQARAGAGGMNVLDDVNTEQVIAWKNGAFSFYKDDLRAVLRQISRWYDVEVVYEGELPERSFSGKMGRDLTLSQIMNFLKEVKVDLKLEGRKIIVVNGKF